AHRDAAAGEPRETRAASSDRYTAGECEGRVRRADRNEDRERDERSFVRAVHGVVELKRAADSVRRSSQGMADVWSIVANPENLSATTMHWLIAARLDFPLT